MTHLINNGFISFSVCYLYIYNSSSSNRSDIDGFYITGKTIDDFYAPSNSFEINVQYEDKSLPPATISIKTVEEKEIGNFNYKGEKIEVKISALPTLKNTSTPISSKSIMKFHFLEKKDHSFVIDVYKQCQQFFYYICGNTFIQVDDIQIFNMGKDGLSNNGVIRVINDNHQVESVNRDTNKIIKYDLLKEKSILLFEAIVNEEIYFNHLRCYENSPNSYGIDRIILDFVAFEREFRNLYDEEVDRSAEYNVTRDEVLKCLYELKGKKTGKSKNYVNRFIKSFGKLEIKFADKFSKCLLDCEEELLPFLSHDYKNYCTDMIEDIGERLNKLRNDSVHGNIDLQIDPINISDFATIENLWYAMRLKHIGLDKKEIQCAINNLKNSHMRIL